MRSIPANVFGPVLSPPATPISVAGHWQRVPHRVLASHGGACAKSPGGSPNNATADLSVSGGSVPEPDYTGQSVPVLMRRRHKSLQAHEGHSAQSRRRHQVILPD